MAIIGWWSAGITSAVACKVAIEQYGDAVELFYIETGSAHPDNARFKADCEKWYGKTITTIRNSKGFKDHVDVVLKTRYVNGPDGARCTGELKKEVRYELQKARPDITNHIFGFEYEIKQVNRAIRFIQQYPDTNPRMPLIEKGLTKANCAGILITNGMYLPRMYEMGYGNNNCIGCVKGGMGYWNKIRVDFPEYFNKMAQAERIVGHSCIKDVFLDELGPNKGRKQKIVTPECGTFCDIELADIPAKNLDAVMNKTMTIYEAALTTAA